MNKFIKKSQFVKIFCLQLTVWKGDFLQNIITMGEWKASQNFAKLGKPVNKEKWSTEPAVVNAFYDPNKNDIGNIKACHVKVLVANAIRFQFHPPFSSVFLTFFYFIIYNTLLLYFYINSFPSRNTPTTIL